MEEGLEDRCGGGLLRPVLGVLSKDGESSYYGDVREERK